MSVPSHTLFKRDLFSDPKPHFYVTSDEVGRMVENLLSIYYPQMGNQIGEIYQSGSIELNSNNFLVDVGQNRLIVKRIPVARNNRDNLMRQIMLSNWLSGKGLPVPFIYESVNGNLLNEFGGWLWCVLDFVDGAYFCGSKDELEDVVDIVKRLFLVFRDVPDDIFVNQQINPPGETDQKLVMDLETVQWKWSSLFGAEHAALIGSALPEIKKNLRTLLTRRDTLMEGMGLCHIDMHPHNLIMQNKQVAAILDCASYLTAPVEVIIAFNVFKLLRQRAVIMGREFDKSVIVNMCSQIVGMLSSAGLISKQNFERMAFLAKVEIMRRLLLIIRMTLEQGDCSWNHVLPVQIVALTEAEILFDFPISSMQ